jgi:hypothetical protein
MKRREFIVVVGGVASWPLAVHAQHTTMPVIGYINSRSADESQSLSLGGRQCDGAPERAANR